MATLSYCNQPLTDGIVDHREDDRDGVGRAFNAVVTGVVWATIRSGAKLMSSAAKVRTRTGSRMRCEWHSAQLAHSQDHKTDQWCGRRHRFFVPASSSSAGLKRNWIAHAMRVAFRQLAHSQDHQTDQFDHGTHSISSSVARSKRWLWLPLALETASILRISF